MLNFIAFRFTDNDFHDPLRDSVDFLVSNYGVEPLFKMTTEKLNELTRHAMLAYHILRNVLNDRLDNDQSNLLEYFKKLKVTKIDRLAELDSGFEGYVINAHTGFSFYQGY